MVSKILFINLMLHRRVISVVLVTLLHLKSSSVCLEELFMNSLFFVGKIVDMGTQVIALLCFGREHCLH